jgi:hypothetical protein
MLNTKRKDASGSRGVPENVVPAALCARLFVYAMARQGIRGLQPLCSGLCDEVIGVLSAKNQTPKAISLLLQDAIDDIRGHAFALGREQFDIHVVEFE